MISQLYPAIPLPGVAVGVNRVGVLRMKMKVAVEEGVTDGVFVGKGVNEGVKLAEGATAAVCVEAATAV